MRPSIRILLLAFAAAPLACTSLLGTFEVGGAPANGGDDSGANGDTGANDGGTNDGSADAPVSADADAAPDDFAQLTCAPDTTSKTKLATLGPSFTNGQGLDRIWGFSYDQNGGGRAAVAVTADANNVIHGFTFPVDGGGATSDAQLVPPANGGFRNLVAVERIRGGVAALVIENYTPDGGPPRPIGLLYKLIDGSGSWGSPLPVTTVDEFAPVGTSCIDRLSATFNARDLDANDIDVVFQYRFGQLSAGNCTTGSMKMKAGRIRVTAPQPLKDWPAPANAAQVEFLRDGMISAPNHSYVLLNPGNSGGQPKAGDTALIYQATAQDLTYESQYPVPIGTAGNFLVGFGMRGFAPDGVGFAFLEANLTSASAKPTFLVGGVQATDLFTVNPSKALPPTVLDSVNDLPVNKGSLHVESFDQPPSHNIVASGLALPSAAGFSFLWWDGKGRLRARNSASTPGGPLFAPGPNVTTLGGSFFLASAPNILFSKFQVVWAEKDNSPNPFTVWTASLQCTK